MEVVKHGGMTSRVATMLEETRKAADVRSALAERLRRGEPVYGFGHPLYAGGDPRAAFLLEALRRRLNRSAELAFAFRVISAAEELMGDQPTIDFALVVLERVLKLPHASALPLFALGRLARSTRIGGFPLRVLNRDFAIGVVES